MAVSTSKQPKPENRPRLADVTSRRANQDVKTLDASKHHTCQEASSEPSLLPPSEKEIASYSYVENKHLSAFIEKHGDPKRDSQISVSTNASISTPAARKRKTHIGPWLLGKTLGKGATCRVRKAKHEVTGQEAAVKIVSRRIAYGHQSSSVLAMDKILAKHPRWARERRVPFGIEREVVIMKLIEHPRIVKLYDVWENRGEMYLVLELVEGGELFDYIAQNGGMPEHEAVRLFRQLLAGVGHCHRFRLCHRDLKPENILLDKDFNVKIADFGMASMQHTKYLETSCGSPHYAAPEVAQGLRYEGEKADIWSMGVVLYVMLTGTVPFGAHVDTNDPETREDKVRMILDEVVHFDVEIPTFVSQEAEDLLLFLLLKQPDQRPPIEWIWDHPLLHKHNDYLQHTKCLSQWTEGPEPELTEVDCGPPLTDASEVDLDIVGNLCILWHTTDEKGIIDALLSKSNNYEQVFYHRLLHHRKEQEENFHGSSVEPSASDYHHVAKSRLRKSATRSTMAAAPQKRQRSQFSIAGGHANPTKRSVSEAGTDKSYDPFRASRTQMSTRKAESAKITVIRSSPRDEEQSGSLKSSFRSSVPLSTAGRTMDNGKTRTNSWVVAQRSSSMLQPPILRGMHSRSSLGSSIQSHGGSQRGHRSASYKRKVVFMSRQRCSGRVSVHSMQSAPPSTTSAQIGRPRDSWQTTTSFPNTSIMESISPAMPVKTREEPVGICENHLDHNKNNRYSAYLTEQARHISRELGQYCDSVFQESCVDLGSRSPANTCDITTSSWKQSVPNDHTKLEPPPRKSSINQTSHSHASSTSNTLIQHNLPNTPAATPFANSTVEKLLHAQAALVAEAASMPSEELKTSLAAINRMIHSARNDQRMEESRRIASAPPSIRVNGSTLGLSEETKDGTRHVSEPNPTSHGLKTVTHNCGWGPGQSTIRVVHDAGMKPAPLIVRKKSSIASINSNHSEGKSQFTPLNQNLLTGKSGDHASNSPWDQTSSYCGTLYQAEMGLETIAEDDKENYAYHWPKSGSKDGKLRSLFRRSGSSKSTDSDCGPPPPAKDVPHLPTLDPIRVRPSAFRVPIDEMSEDIEFEEVPSERASRRRGFLSFFGWKTSRAKHSLTMFAGTNDSSSVLSSELSTSHPRTNELRNRSTTSIGKVKAVKFDEPELESHFNTEPQNWLSKFLRVRPAKYVMALQMNHTAALKEIRGILKDWRRYGMRDIVVDRAAGKISARVGAENSLHIKSVSISIELFTVLQRGRKHNLGVARFTQDMGARSSFEKVVSTMKDVLRGRDLLVSDKKKTREMRRCLRDWESG